MNAEGIFGLAGRGVGLTGGGGHLGQALALGLAEAGAKVLICGRREEPLRALAEAAQRLARGPGSVEWMAADVARDDALESVLDRLVEWAGAVHGWVNCACESRPQALLELDREGVADSLEGVLGALMRATSAVARRMREQEGGGSIVNIASMYGRVSPQPASYRAHPQYHSPPAYGAAKAGVIQFTRYAACHLAADAIRVNCVSPGPFPSPDIAGERAFRAELERRVPLGRVGQPSELVGPVVFLLSDASSFVTGHDLAVDGGWSAW